MPLLPDLARGALVSALLSLLGCALPPAPEAPSALLFLREDAQGRRPYAQALPVTTAPEATTLPSPAGHLQTAPAARLVALTVGSEAGRPASLQLLRLDAALTPTERWTLAPEWAFDYHLRGEGDAIAWVAGSPARQLFVARAPAWQPQPIALPAGSAPSDPRWIDARHLALLLRHPDRSEAAILDLTTGALAVVHRARAGVLLADLRPIPGSAELLVMETPATPEPARILSLSTTGGAAHERARGWFVPGSLTVSPDGRFRAVASAPDLSSLHQRATRLEWLGSIWPGAADNATGVEALAWSPEGERLALTRLATGRRAIEIRRRDAAPAMVGFPDASCTTPQWWSPLVRARTPSP